MKDTFVLSTKYGKQISRLDMSQRGLLFTAILMYESGEELPELDTATQMAFDFIREDLDENREKYEETCRRNRESGRLGGRPKKADGLEKTERFSENRTQAKKADSDSDSDSECDSDSDIYKAPKGALTTRVKHKHGVYRHVLLTDREYQSLISEYGEDRTSDAIRFLDEYIEMKGAKYKSCYLAMRKWVFNAVEEKRARDKPAAGLLPYSGIDW